MVVALKQRMSIENAFGNFLIGIVTGIALKITEQGN
jgi:hypothetical protein